MIKRAARAFVTVTSGSGRSETRELVGRMTMGTSTMADFCLFGEAAIEPLHLVFVPRGDEGCWVARAYRARTPVMVAGQEWEAGVIPWGTELAVGDILVRVERKVGEPRRSWARGKRVFGAGSVVVAVAVAAVSIGGGAVGKAPSAATAAPGLFSDAGCPEDVDRTSHAYSLRGAAASWGERYPFAPGDGIKAVQMYDEAAACFEASGMTEQARETASSAAALRREIERDYAAARLALARSVKGQDRDAMLAASRRLLALLEHTPRSQYAERVRRIARMVTVMETDDAR